MTPVAPFSSVSIVDFEQVNVSWVVIWEWFCTYYINLVENIETKIFGFCNTRWFYSCDTQVLSLQTIWKNKCFEVYPESLLAWHYFSLGN